MTATPTDDPPASYEWLMSCVDPEDRAGKAGMGGAPKVDLRADTGIAAQPGQSDMREIGAALGFEAVTAL